MNPTEHVLALLRANPTFTVTAHNGYGWSVDLKRQMVAVGPAETVVLAQIGITLPMRGELVAAAIQKQQQAIVQATPPASFVPAAKPPVPWKWIAIGGGGLLAGVFLTILLTRHPA